MADNRIRWDVRIQFEQGEHVAGAWAATQRGAYRLALQDARMGHPFGCFDGPVVSWDAVPTEEIAA